MSFDVSGKISKEEQELYMKDDSVLPQEAVSSSLKWRELLLKIVQSDYSIESVTWRRDESGNLNGVVSFSVPLKTLGLNVCECKYTYNRELFSNFMMDFIGELYIRNNLEKFTEQVLSMTCQSYSETVSSKSHEFFGAVLNEKKSTFELSFFANLIQRIMTEDFKLHVMYEKNEKDGKTETK